MKTKRTKEKKESAFKKWQKYHWPFLVVFAFYVLMVVLRIGSHEESYPIKIVETMKQYVFIMGSLAGFSLLVMGYLMFEISSAKLKLVDIDLHEKNKVIVQTRKNLLLEENEQRKTTVTVFLICFIVTLLGSVIAAIGSSQMPEECVRALSVFLPSSSFMMLSILFLMIGLGRMIDAFDIRLAKRFFKNLMMVLILFALVEFAGSIDDATTLPNGDSQIKYNQPIALLIAFLAVVFGTLKFKERLFTEKYFTRYAFFSIIVGTGIYLYSELFVQETFKETQLTPVWVAYLILTAMSLIVGSAYPYILPDPSIANEELSEF